MRKRYVLDFDGFWIEDSIDKVPAASGVYVVYGGIYNEETKETALETIIYVGGATNAQAAITSSPHWDEWREASRLPLNPDEPEEGFGEVNDIFFAFAPVTVDNDPERAAAAVVFEQMPKVNTSTGDFDAFPYEDTKMSVTGKTGLLNTQYEVYFE